MYTSNCTGVGGGGADDGGEAQPSNRTISSKGDTADGWSEDKLGSFHTCTGAGVRRRFMTWC